MHQKKLPIPLCLTTVDIVWSRPLCDRVSTVTFQRSDFTNTMCSATKIIACDGVVSRIHGTTVLVRVSTVLYVVCLAHAPHTTCKRKAG